MFLKSPDAVIGDGDTVVLPNNTSPYMFQHEAELGIVFKGPAKDVTQADWQSAVFGYTCMIDVSARAQGRSTWRSGSWMGKSFNTFGPLGPCITTADEITEPNNLWVKFWNNGELRHDYVTDDMEHRVPELVEFATNIMTMNSGDVLSCGTNHEGLGPLQDGETGVIEIQGIGRMTIHVSDPLKRDVGARHLHGRKLNQPRSRSGPPTTAGAALARRSRKARNPDGWRRSRRGNPRGCPKLAPRLSKGANGPPARKNKASRTPPPSSFLRRQEPRRAGTPLRHSGESRNPEGQGRAGPPPLPSFPRKQESRGLGQAIPPRSC